MLLLQGISSLQYDNHTSGCTKWYYYCWLQMHIMPSVFQLVSTPSGLSGNSGPIPGHGCCTFNFRLLEYVLLFYHKVINQSSDDSDQPFDNHFHELERGSNDILKSWNCHSMTFTMLLKQQELFEIDLQLFNSTQKAPMYRDLISRSEKYC